jgi:hypothetical protein
MTKAEMLAAVRSLVVERGQLDTSQVPTGLTTALPTYTGPTGDVQIDLSFGPLDQQLNLLVHQITDSSWQATRGSRQVTVNGVIGWLRDDGPGGDVTLTWELAPGVVGSLSGETTPQRLLKVAAVLKNVPVTDSRLTRRH